MLTNVESNRVEGGVKVKHWGGGDTGANNDRACALISTAVILTRAVISQQTHRHTFRHLDRSILCDSCFCFCSFARVFVCENIPWLKS